jgi:Flp pilus assembly protein TadG
MAPLNIRRRLMCERGAELIEFAIVTPLLLLLVFGITDFGLMFQRYEVLTNAAREGARVAALPGYASADVQARVDQYLTGSGVTPVTTTYLTPAAVNVGTACITLTGATVTYNFSFIALGGIIKLFPGGSGFTTKTLTATALMRYEGPAGTCPAT